MRLVTALTLLLAALAAAPLAGAPLAAQARQLAPGDYVGALDVGGIKLRVGFSVRARPDGSFEADLDSYDQGTMNIPVDSVRVAGDSVGFWFRRIGGSYRGMFEGDGRAIAGTWLQGPASFPLRLTYADSAAVAVFAPRRSQVPKPPFPYRVEELAVESAPGVRLSGTLTLPQGAGPFPAVVLVSGSGAQDRDETLAGHKPFLVLSDYLTRRGIAVYRYDDRGTARSTGNHAAATSEDFAVDARAAVAALRARTDIRRDAVGIVGHSEGGLIAPLVARDPAAGVGFVVMLAGPGIPGDSILILQADLIAKAGGTPDSVRARARVASRRIYDVVRTERDTVRLVQRVREQTRAIIAATANAQPLPDSTMVELQVRQLTSPWFRYFLSYDPRPTLRAVKVPVLALNGTLDLQVPHAENLSAIGDALRAGGNRDVTLLELPRLNHLFQTATTGAPSEYASIEETFAPAALQRIGDWILERFRPATP